jgi:hypothetical protein
MLKMYKKLIGLGAFVVVTLPQLVLAAGGGPIAPMVIVADTRKLDGIMKWWGDLYNNSYWEFTILTVALIPLIGVCFGVVADIVMTRIGIDLKSRELAEH